MLNLRCLRSLSAVLLFTFFLLAATPLPAVTLALAADSIGCVNLVDVDAPQSQLLPYCSALMAAGEADVSELLALWSDGDDFAAVARDVLGDEGTFVAHFPSLAVQDFSTGRLSGTRGATLVFSPALGASPSVRDGAVLGDGTVVLLVGDQNAGLFWVTELDPATGEVTPLGSIDPDLDASIEGGIADLGGGEVLVSLLDGSFDPALYAVELATGEVDRLEVAIRSGLFVSIPTSLIARPDGAGFFYTTLLGTLVDLVIEPTANGRRGRFTGDRIAGREEWYQPSHLIPMLAFLTPSGLPAGCVPDGETLCLLEGRYRVSVDWDTGGATGSGIAIQTTADGGEFYFFSPNNIEMLVKILDGCAINQNVWVFAAATTNVGFELRVEDTATGAVRTYLNPQGTPAVTRTDTEAFPGGCPAARTPSTKISRDEIQELLRQKQKRLLTD